ncbi:MAG TPA: 4-carboxy-4-hydroxy-2-oxoadipate aldolase/oxaloacetate decarboxylase [Steroidobacteraceae bacterium]|nr:4-carboxy-4-hydroxy-2-oxoadipate aldolase/oxaloacetate decarboxylase [Steroidobacteraceae bacterium]
MNAQRLDPTLTTRRDIVRVTRDLSAAAAEFPTATLHEAAGKIGALPWAIKPVASSFRLCGPAVTVQAPGGDNLWLHRALDAAESGDVLVVHVSGAYDHGYWGEIMSTAAQARGLGGLVIDGCVRDGVLLEQIGFPVFARGLCIRGTGKDFGARGWINSPILFHDVVVAPGDLVVGDGDGVMCIPREQVPAVLDAARTRTHFETEVLERLRNGESTLRIYGWA